jgi:hypothetical protein
MNSALAHSAVAGPWAPMGCHRSGRCAPLPPRQRVPVPEAAAYSRIVRDGWKPAQRQRGPAARRSAVLAAASGGSGAVSRSAVYAAGCCGAHARCRFQARQARLTGGGRGGGLPAAPRGEAQLPAPTPQVLTLPTVITLVRVAAIPALAAGVEAAAARVPRALGGPAVGAPRLLRACHCGVSEPRSARRAALLCALSPPPARSVVLAGGVGAGRVFLPVCRRLPHRLPRRVPRPPHGEPAPALAPASATAPAPALRSGTGPPPAPGGRPGRARGVGRPSLRAASTVGPWQDVGCRPAAHSLCPCRLPLLPQNASTPFGAFLDPGVPCRLGPRLLR